MLILTGSITLCVFCHIKDFSSKSFMVFCSETIFCFCLLNFCKSASVFFLLIKSEFFKIFTHFLDCSADTQCSILISPGCLIGLLKFCISKVLVGHAEDCCAIAFTVFELILLSLKKGNLIELILLSIVSFLTKLRNYGRYI